MKNSQAHLRQFIKRQLKHRKLTYKEMAKKLGVSEIAFKKWMTVNDFKVETLVKIGKILELDFFDLLKKDSTGLKDYSMYSPEQDEYFAKHPIDWVIFIKIRHRFSSEEIIKELKINSSEFAKSIARLEKNRILESWPNKKIRMKIKGPLTIPQDGQMIKVLFGALRDHLFQHFKTKFRALTPMHNLEAESLFRTFQMHLSEASQKDLIQELMQLISKYLQIAESELSQELSIKPISVVVGVDQYDGWSHTVLDMLSSSSKRT